MNFPVCEMFTSIQGEGKRAGIPTIFIRVSGCNLRCVFKNSMCDTPYASFEAEKTPYKSMDDFIQAFHDLRKANNKIKDLCITGGEPLMYSEGLKEFLIRCKNDVKDMYITIETNGTYPPLPILTKEYHIDLYSVSPKLSTSVDHECKFLTAEQKEKHDKMRLNYKNMFDIIMNTKDYQMKFVYSGPECIDEILQIYSKISNFVEAGDECEFSHWMYRHPNKHTMLMPEGVTTEQLASNRKEIVEECIRRGWSYTDRLQILIWGDKRGV